MIREKWSDEDYEKYQEFQPSKLRSDLLWTLLQVARRPQSSSWDIHDYYFVFYGTAVNEVPDDSLTLAHYQVLKNLVKNLIDFGMVEGSTNIFNPTDLGWVISKKDFDQKYEVALNKGKI